ncbi:hypothetical protein V8C35DRAFT_307675 [Trichoderma chlorosporum]
MALSSICNRNLPILDAKMDAVDGTVSVLRFLLELFIISQQARGFEDEFRRYQLHVQMQLANCSSLVHKMDSPRGSLATYAWILGAVQDALLKAQREAAKINDVCTRAKLPLVGPGTCITKFDLNKMRLTTYLDNRKNRAAKKVEAIKWALYRRAICDKFVRDIHVLLQDIERQVGRERDADITGMVDS